LRGIITDVSCIEALAMLLSVIHGRLSIYKATDKLLVNFRSANKRVQLPALFVLFLH